MDNTREINYRNRILRLNKEMLDKYEYLLQRPICEANIDQYLLNEADKSNIDPFNVDFNKLSMRFTDEEIEKHVNDYLEFEVFLRGGDGFKIPKQ